MRLTIEVDFRDRPKLGRWVRRALIALCLLSSASVAGAYPITDPHIYVNGEYLDQSILNPPLTTLYTWANGGVDNSNVNNAVGFFADQTICSTTATCTFGNTVALTVPTGLLLTGAGNIFSGAVSVTGTATASGNGTFQQTIPSFSSGTLGGGTSIDAPVFPYAGGSYTNYHWITFNASANSAVCTTQSVCATFTFNLANSVAFQTTNIYCSVSTAQPLTTTNVIIVTQQEFIVDVNNAASGSQTFAPSVSGFCGGT
jgi:hypothetical protein